MRAVFFPMVALLALAGAYCVWQGADIIQLERGWATVISGAVAFSSGLVIIALGLLVDEDYRMCDASGAGQPGIPAGRGRPRHGGGRGQGPGAARRDPARRLAHL